MVWLTDVSTFVLNMACGFIKNGVPMVKGFKIVQLKAIEEVVLKISGRDVGHDEIYNHLPH
jgi:hypothetical protein